ncbi:14075_t:CDS:2, partial [Dentiscutata heterogama]
MSQSRNKSIYNYKHNYSQNKTIKCKAKTYTLPEQYKIPDDYKIKTTWGKPNKEITIITSINYINNKPIYKIECVDKKTYKEEEVYSDKPSSNAALLFSK